MNSGLQVAKIFAWCGLGAFGGAWLLTQLAALHWTAELLTHFSLQAGLSGALLIVACAFLRMKWATALSVVLSVAYLVPVFPYLVSRTPNDLGTFARLRVLGVNVHTTNRNHAAVLALIRSENPDVIGLMEVDEVWLESLAALHSRYPYRVEHPQGDNFGIALFSRFPLDGAQVVPLVLPSVSLIVAHFSLGSRPVTIVVAHPIPPSGSWNSAMRDRQLNALAELRARYHNREFVLLGDLNTTPFSPSYRALERATGLTNAGLGFGYTPTWPVQHPALMIPIDHCLVSAGLEVVAYRTGSATGSDHLPVVVEIVSRQPLESSG